MKLQSNRTGNADLYIPTQHHDRQKPNPKMEAGLTLPRYLERNFPPELIATPIEDIDQYYLDNEPVSSEFDTFGFCNNWRGKIILIHFH